jgi:hypothetical protein
MSKAISEKTLELNITHEILNIADSFWWYLQPIALKRYWSPGFRFPLMQYPKSYSLGLSLEKESKEGWDVCIKSPQFIGGDPYALFLQFKAGQHYDYSTNNLSIFYGDKNNPNPHIKFSINNNTNKDQHLLLRKLSKAVGKNDAVLYSFPRIVDEKQLTEKIGRLLYYTSFFSVNEIDDKANMKNVTIQKGTSHEFRSDYDDFLKNEINSTPFTFDAMDLMGKALAEVISLRIYRALYSLQQLLKKQNDLDIHGKNITEAFIRFIKYLSIYLNIDLNVQLPLFTQYERMYKYLAKFKSSPQKFTDHSSRGESIFKDVIQLLSKYFLMSEETHFNLHSNIKPPAFDILIRIPEEGLFLTINNLQSDSDLLFEDIAYSLF